MKKMIVGLILVVMVAVAGCGTSVTDPRLSQVTSGTGETGSVQMRINLYDQGGATFAAPKRAGGLMRVQDIMKGMTKKFVVYLYEVDGSGNFNGGLIYTSTTDVVNGVADIVIQNVSAGRSYDVSVNGMDENAQHNFFYSYQKSVLVSAGATTIADAALIMVDAYWIDSLVLSNISGTYEVGGVYNGTEEVSFFGNNLPISCTFIEQGKASCTAIIPTAEISTMEFRITDANSVVHSYTIKVGIRDALDDGRIDFDLASGNIVLTASFPFDVDSIYVDNLTSEAYYVWLTSQGGLPIGIAVGDTLDFIYNDGVSDVVEHATVTAYDDGSGYYCKVAWKPQLPQEWWNKSHYSVRKHLDLPVV